MWLPHYRLLTHTQHRVKLDNPLCGVGTLSVQCVHAIVGGSPYTADPRDISMEEDAETPLETLQLQVINPDTYMCILVCMYIHVCRFLVRVVILVTVCWWNCQKTMFQCAHSI